VLKECGCAGSCTYASLHVTHVHPHPAPQVILMDEASSALDHASDMALQHAIRSTFGGCTVLTIAHRLNTIIASDKVR
jgi:ABC-type transport system involved in cytochrome bd biosynthesis fused ATPase/permease subunit